MAHIWIITFDVAPWEGGGGDTCCKKIFFFRASVTQEISCKQFCKFMFMNLWFHRLMPGELFLESLGSLWSFEAISWFQWNLFLDFRAFSPPSLLHGPLPGPESGAPQTLPLMKISTQHFKLFTFLETILHTKYFLNYFIMKGTSVITCAEIVAEYFESSAVCEFPHCCVSNSGPRPSSRWLYFLQNNKSKPSTVLSLVGWSHSS